MHVRTLALFVALAACTGAVADETQDSDDRPAVETATAETAGEPIGEAATAARAVLSLAPNGIVLGGEDIIFDRAQTDVLAQLAAFEPDPPRSNQECGAGPMEFVDIGGEDLTLNFHDDRFVGWYLDGKGPGMATSEGISVGSTRAALDVAMDVQVDPESTLGIEFYSERENGFIAGFLTGEGSDATVESLYAGTNCFFR